MEYKKWVKFPVFYYKIEIVYTTTITVSRYRRNKYLGATDEDFSCYEGLASSSDKRGIGAIFFRPDSSIGTIAHECFHAIYRMMNYKEAGMDNETWAYHIDYLVQAAVDFKNECDKKEEKRKASLAH